VAIEDYSPSTAVLCFDGFKEASLYFDRVLPLNMGRMRGDPDVGDILIGFPESVPSAALSHLVDGVEGNTVTYSHATRVMEYFADKWVNFAKGVSPYAHLWAPRPGTGEQHDVVAEYRKLQAAYLVDAAVEGAAPIRTEFAKYASSLGIARFCVALPAESGPIGKFQDPSLTLQQLQLIDAGKAEWKQIIEIRKDEASHRKLARLRLFLHEKYDGRSFSFVEDDISRRIEDYEQVCKKFGLQTTLSSLSLLLDAKSLQASLGSGLVAALFGGPAAALSAAAAVEIGKVAVHVAEKRHEMKSWQAGHELAYIFETGKAIDSR
jgi:hypothetical protein